MKKSWLVALMLLVTVLAVTPQAVASGGSPAGPALLAPAAPHTHVRLAHPATGPQHAPAAPRGTQPGRTVHRAPAAAAVPSSPLPGPVHGTTPGSVLPPGPVHGTHPGNVLPPVPPTP